MYFDFFRNKDFISYKVDFNLGTLTSHERQ